MALTSRRKRPLDRSIPHFRDTRLIIIATEGEKTEKQYFESDLFRNHRVQVRVLETEDGRSAPQHVLDRLREYVKNVDLQKDDQLWLVVDTDRFPERHMKKVFQSVITRRKIRINSGVSNPCFELWLLFHLEDNPFQNNSIRCCDVKKRLKENLGGYNSSRLVIEDYRNGIDLAVERARSMDLNPDERWPNQTGTRIYKIIDAIREFKQA